MQKTEEIESMRRRLRIWAMGGFLLMALVTSARGQSAGSAGRTRLILKDGGYQVVLSYEVVGSVVRYRSAERDGEPEDIPLAMVDLPATERWQREHAPAAASKTDRPVLSPELAAEEAARRSKTPEVAPNLRLPVEDSVLALDRFHGAPELVPLQQEGTDLNKETAHAVQELAIRPEALAHGIVELKGPAAEVQLHGPQPVFYVRVGEDDVDTPGGAMVLDLRGAGGRPTPSGGAAKSGYVLERVEVRQDLRVVNSFRIQELETGRAQPDVIEMRQETLPGGHWLKLTPVSPLEEGEYALIEVLNDHALNLNLWDFGVNAAAKESYEAIKPEVPKPVGLTPRPRP
jgi:hypothetical protein